MKDIIKQFIGAFLSGDSTKIVSAIILIIFLLIILPYILNPFFVDSWTRTKLDILDKLSKIDREQLKDLELRQLYDSILQDIRDTPIGFSNSHQFNFFDLFSGDNLVKFISGGFLLWLCIFAVIFAKYKHWWQYFIGFIFIIIFGGIVGIIGVLLPTFEPLIINVISFPVLQLIVITILILKYNKTKKENSN